MTEKGAIFTFAPGLTSISFPTSLPSYPNFTFNATVSHRLSFFDCDFVLPPSSEPQSSLLSLLILIPHSWHLFHMSLSHLIYGIDALDILGTLLLMRLSLRTMLLGLHMKVNLTRTIVFLVLLANNHNALLCILAIVLPLLVDYYM